MTVGVCLSIWWVARLLIRQERRKLNNHGQTKVADTDQTDRQTKQKNPDFNSEFLPNWLLFEV